MQKLGDPIVSKFDQAELNPIIMENAYHSPEESETDEGSNQNHVVIWDLSWRSDTVSIRWKCFSQIEMTLTQFIF